MDALFTLQPRPVFKSLVSISLPGGDVGQIEFEFRHKSKPEVKKWMEAAKGRADIDVLAEVVVGWCSRVVDANGAVVPFSRSALESLLANYHPAAKEIYVAYLKSLSESRAKN